MTVAFQVVYVVYFVGVVALGGLALVGVAGRLPGWSVHALRVAALIGAASLVLRSVEAGHLPIFGTFENTLTASVFLLAAAVLTSRARRTLGSWAWAVPWGLGLLLYGTRFSSDAIPLTISEQSLWVDVHVVFAWLAFSGLLLASTLSLSRVLGRAFWGLPADEADEYVARTLNLGFLALTATILIGAWYLYILFATFWRWDVVGTLSLAAWLGYGMVIHARYFYRLSGRGLAVAVLSVLPFLILMFWVWSVLPGTYHYFDVPLLKPY